MRRDGADESTDEPIREVESGERLPQFRRKVGFDGMKDRIELPAGWDDPIDLEHFLAGEL